MGTAESIRWSSFRIDELDCPDEVLLIRQMLEGHAGVIQLETDVFHHRLNVRYRPQLLSGEELVEMLSRAGMTAQPWEDDYQEATPGTWQQHGRSWMTLASWSPKPTAATVLSWRQAQRSVTVVFTN